MTTRFSRRFGNTSDQKIFATTTRCPDCKSRSVAIGERATASLTEHACLKPHDSQPDRESELIAARFAIEAGAAVGMERIREAAGGDPS